MTTLLSLVVGYTLGMSFLIAWTKVLEEAMATDETELPRLLYWFGDLCVSWFEESDHAAYAFTIGLVVVEIFLPFVSLFYIGFWAAQAALTLL